MIKHVCLIHFKEGTDTVTREAVKAAYEKLPGLIPGLRSLSVGLDAGLLEGNAHLVIIGEFGSREDFLVYSQHQAHMDVIFPVCGPVMASYSTAQVEV